MDKQKKVIILHPTGNMNTRAAAVGFHKANILACFYTCIACFEHSFLYHLSSIHFLKEFRRRVFDKSLEGITCTHPWREIGRQIMMKLKWVRALNHETGYFCIDKVYQDLDSYVAHCIHKHHEHIHAVYAYEDCALRTFQEAKRHQKYCLYDLPIGYWRSMRKLLKEEQQCNPEWAMTLGGFSDSEAKLRRKDAELALADKIYVASSFTKQTLKLYPGTLADIEVIPYGFPPINRHRTYQSFDGRKIKVLFVGGLSQRKGISYLFESLEGLEHEFELTVVGIGDIEKCPILKKKLQKANYIPSLPHDAILKLMAEHDLLIFPSLFEGFGLVITEAMSQGTPVITTERTCGPDIITHGKDGWIVKAGSAQPIRELLEQFISNPMILQEVGRNALKTASSRPWPCYEQELATSVNTFLHGNTL